MEFDKSKNIWNKIYEKNPAVYVFQEDLNQIIEIFKQEKVKTILDLGCGSGTYIEPLIKEGFIFYGIDISDIAIESAKKSIKKKNIRAFLKVGSIFNPLPFDDNIFDSIISIRSIYHGTIEQIRMTIQEIERVLRPGGFIFITFRRKKSKKNRLATKKIAPRTYIPLVGNEKELVHYFFTPKIIESEFRRFSNIEFSKNKEYYYLYGKL